MSKRPLEGDDGFEVNKEAVAASKIYAAQVEIKRLQGLYTQAVTARTAARRQAEEFKSGAAGLAKELSDQRKENDELKRKCEETENLKQFELARMRDEEKRLQRHIAILKDYKRKYEDLKQKKQADEETEKEKIKIKTKILNRQLKDEKNKIAERKEEKVESSGYSEDIFVTLSEENKKLREEKESLDMREKMNATVDEYEESNKKLREEVKESIEMGQKLSETVDGYKESNEALTKQLEWYKNGWIVYHEYAREQINKGLEDEFKLPRESIPLPPSQSHNPLMMPPVFIDDDSTACELAHASSVSYHYLHKKIIKTEIINKYTKTAGPNIDSLGK